MSGADAPGSDNLCTPCTPVANAAPDAVHVCNPIDGTGIQVSECDTGFYKVHMPPGAGDSDTCVACSECEPGMYGTPCTSGHDTTCEYCAPVLNAAGLLTCRNMLSRVEHCNDGFYRVPGNETTADLCQPLACAADVAVPFTLGHEYSVVCNAGGHPLGPGFMQACEAEPGCEYRDGECTLKTVSPGVLVESGSEVDIGCDTWEPGYSGVITFACEQGVLRVDRHSCMIPACSGNPCGHGICNVTGPTT